MTLLRIIEDHPAHTHAIDSIIAFGLSRLGLSLSHLAASTRNLSRWRIKITSACSIGAAGFRLRL